MKHILKKVIAIATVVTMLAAVPAMDAQAAVVKYATYTNTRFTYTVKYPTTFQRADYGSGDGTKLFSKDGKAKATIWNSYKMGKNTIQYCYVFIKNGEIAFQLTYPTASKKYYSAAAKGMMASLKKNKSLTLND